MYYRPLFQFNVLHHYHLNRGVDDYNSMSEDDQLEALEKYRVSDFLEICPSRSTIKYIENHRLKLVVQQRGITVLAPLENLAAPIEPLIPLDAAFKFRFAMFSKDAFFESYSVIEADKSNHRLYSVVGNTTFPNDLTLDGSLLLTDTATRDLVVAISHENEDHSLLSLAKIDSSMMSPAEKEIFINKAITAEKNKGLLGYFTISLGAIPPFGDADPSPMINLHIPNRSMDWHYVDGTGTTTIENNRPIVKHGFVEVGKPNPELRDIKVNSSNEYYAEINI